MNAMQIFRRQYSTPAFRRILHDGHPQPLRQLHVSSIVQAPRKRNFFSSNAALQQEANSTKDDAPDSLPPNQKRKPARASPGKTSLRRVAVEAQRSRSSTIRQRDASSSGDGSNRVTAISVADQFDMNAVGRILKSHGFPIDPDGTGFDSDEVIHTRGANNGDIFVFPSGSLVAWSLPEDVASDLATKTLLPAAIDEHVDQVDIEDLEYKEDPTKIHSSVKGDMIILGTKIDSKGEGQLT